MKMDMDALISTVCSITVDLERGMDYESLDSKYADFKEHHPKVYSLAKGDPGCLAKLRQIKTLRDQKAEGTSQYEASAIFGQTLADQYLVRK